MRIMKLWGLLGSRKLPYALCKVRVLGDALRCLEFRIQAFYCLGFGCRVQGRWVVRTS